jgi:SAM-dependent methyltransferase
METPAPPRESTPFDDGDLYDVVFERFDYGIEFYLTLARTARGPILDLACGTGRVMLPCLKAGLIVDGVDLHGSMLARLETKAAALGFKPRLHEAGMASFQLDRKYGLIMIPFNSVVHNLTADDQISTFRRCREHLLPGGLFVFDTFLAGPGLLTAPENKRDLEIEVSHPQTGLPIRQYDTRRLNRVEQMLFSSNEIEFLDAAGNVTEVRKSQTTLRWIYKGEMELLLRLGGFERWEILGGFDGRLLEKDDELMIVKAWVGDAPSR